MKIIESDQHIEKILGDTKEDVQLLFSESNQTVNQEIISGNIDADRLDYLRRDSYHIGVAYGNFDLERILFTINQRKDGERSYLTILRKGMDALENFRLARYLMHTQVYFHHVRAISDNMLQRAVEVAIRDNTLDEKNLQFNDENFIENYLSLDDSRLFQKILSNPQSNSCDLIRDLENRNLLKRGFEIDLKGINSLKKRKILNMKTKDLRELEFNLAEKCDCDKDFIIAHLQKIDNALYKSSYEFLKAGKTPILIEDIDGNIHELENISPIYAKQEPKYKFFIFCPEKDKPKIREFAKDLISIAIPRSSAAVGTNRVTTFNQSTY